MEQDIQFCTAPDGVNLAYATSGKRSPLVGTGGQLADPLGTRLEGSYLVALVPGIFQRKYAGSIRSSGFGLILSPWNRFLAEVKNSIGYSGSDAVADDPQEVSRIDAQRMRGA